MDLYMDFERPLQEGEIAASRPLLKRLGQGEPWEYIVGKTEFYGCEIGVSPAVLIPRPETEQLVDILVKRLKGTEVVWDICCGSGCIGIALKKALPELTVVLSDISLAAVALAEENGRRNGVEVEVRQGDLFGPFAGEQCDFLVANPPYIAEGEEPPHSVVGFEPKGALFGGSDGLSFYRRFAEALPRFVKRGFWCEIGASQGGEVRKIFGKGEILQDWSGKDRFFFLENE
jgi:release factor glutamine methyltransferase